MLVIERACMEHIAVATAALTSRAAGRARLWQSGAVIANGPAC